MRGITDIEVAGKRSREDVAFAKRAKGGPRGACEMAFACYLAFLKDKGWKGVELALI